MSLSRIRCSDGFVDRSIDMQEVATLLVGSGCCGRGWRVTGVVGVCSNDILGDVEDTWDVHGRWFRHDRCGVDLSGRWRGMCVSW